MDLAPSHDSLSTIIAIIAPGYLAIQVYAAVYSKARKDFSQLLLESIVCGLIIVSVYNGTLHLIGLGSDDVLRLPYYLPLLVIAPLLGLIVSYGRRRRLIRRWVTRFNLPNADHDYLRDSFRQLPPDSIVVVVLKNGETFSGTLASLSIDANSPDQKLTFNNLAWFNKQKRKDQWEAHPGSLIICAGDIQYLETDTPISR
jgi:hypothetical protein